MPDDSRSDGPPDPRSGKPDLDDALRELAEEDRRGLADHPDPVTLLDYHERRLPEAEADRVQEHLARCPECAQAVLDFAAFPDLEPPTEEHRLTPADVQSRWRELRARLEAERRPVWQRHQVLLPLAAGLFVAVVGLGVWAGALRERVERLEGPRGDVYAVSLRPESAGLRGGEVQEIPTWAGRVPVYLSLATAEADYPSYEVDLLTESGRGIVTGIPVRRGPGGPFGLELPRSLLPPGEYRFELFGVQGAAREELGRYPLVVTEGEEQ
jgi:hypothetical protein